jgi:hypothetical protein
MNGKQEWLVEVKVVALHSRIVEAATPQEAVSLALAQGWSDETLNEVESVEVYGEPVPRDDEEDEEEEEGDDA